MKKKTADQPAEEARVTLPGLNLQHMTLRLIGDSPLICHRWSDKAKRQMLDKQMKRAEGAREAKDPRELFEQSLYKIAEGVYGFPVVAFKAAAVDACSHVANLTKVLARGAFHISGELAQIHGSDPEMREDMVRIGMGTSDIRYRGQFVNWSVDLPVRFNANVLSPEQIVNLFEVAGFAIGVGEWRPQRDGSYGMFHVARDGE